MNVLKNKQALGVIITGVALFILISLPAYSQIRFVDDEAVTDNGCGPIPGSNVIFSGTVKIGGSGGVAVSSGDIVVLCENPGTNWNVVVDAPNLTVLAFFGPSQTTLKPSGANPALKFTANADNVTVIGFTIDSTGGTGVLVENGATGIRLFGNHILGTGTGVNNQSANSVDAEDNWWGCAEGPGSAGCPSVSGTVDFTPHFQSAIASLAHNIASASLRATASNSQVNVTVIKNGSTTPLITVLGFSDNPTGVFSPVASRFFEINLSAATGLSNVALNVCSASADTRAIFFTGTVWAQASKQSFDTTNNCVDVTVKSSTTPKLSSLAGGTVFAAGTPVQSVSPGFDLFETDAKSSQFQFKNEFEIPADFFAPGSKPFNSTVKFQGVPLSTFMGKDTGLADTIVQRDQAANLPTIPSSDTIPIEIVALSLQSVEPIKVKVGTATQLWDVKVELSHSQPSTGTMTITKRDLLGGTFDSQLVVQPLFTFTRQSDHVQRIFDVGTLTLTPDSLAKITLKAKRVPWVYDCPTGVLVVPNFNDSFCASASARGRVLTKEQAPLVRQGIRPAQSNPLVLASVVASLPRSELRVTEDVAQFAILGEEIANVRVEIFNLAGVQVFAQEA
ncbi:hypothetical protein HY230_08165, partial [Candidatus Acetothermia bacterium]|nr:hypothetical protein [Candidatus Acetothermia bacterium]